MTTWICLVLKSGKKVESDLRALKTTKKVKSENNFVYRLFILYFFLLYFSSMFSWVILHLQ